MAYSYEKPKYSFSGEYKYKKGLSLKKQSVYLNVYSDSIHGTCIECISSIYFNTFDIKLVDIRDVIITTFEGQPSLIIEYANASIIKDVTRKIILPNLDNVAQVKEILNAEIGRIEEEIRAYQMRLVQQKNEEIEKAKMAELFYKDVYAYHISTPNNPFFTIYSDKLIFIGLYIDKDKSLHFLKIDGNTEEESNAVITYQDIHYYEKAGTVHYTTDINANYNSFGGSITGASISKCASILGGVLLGPMGMAGGALLSHKPAKTTLPSNYLNITSDIHKIDDRSVILNYFSASKNQYMDIELSSDTYNYLQTYLPDKKYGIVLELEKQEAIIQKSKQNSAAQIPSTSDDPKQQETISMENFEIKVKKLKMMYDNGILSEQEFLAEKNKLLSSI